VRRLYGCRGAGFIAVWRGAYHNPGTGGTMSLSQHGVVRVASASPILQLGDPAANAAAIVDLMQAAAAEGASLLALPEMALSGYTLHDLFQQRALLHGVLEALAVLLEASSRLASLVTVVGLPLVVD